MIGRSVDKLIQAMRNEPWAYDCQSERFWEHLAAALQGSFLPDFLTEISGKVEEIIEINPDLSEPEILTIVTRYMVEFLGALSASVRIYDPNTGQMLSFGSHPYQETSRKTTIPLENTIAGEVVKRRQTYLVPSILREDLYRDKGVIDRRGVRSMMAVPFAIPRFFPHERETVGVIQIYYRDDNRRFPPLDIQMAELMARRLSFVMGRKKVLSLYRINEKKEAIVQKVFQKLGSRGGIKMKDVFIRVIPEIADIINVQSSALFSVSDDLEQVVLEAGYPDATGYHGIGKSFPIKSEPAFEILLGREEYRQESPFEVVTPSYLLIIDPQRSPWISNNLKRFAANHNINSILYVPLKVNEEITHFMTFDALDLRKGYSEWEIEIFLFLGRELMRAQKIEQLDDTLHDFKNPAIAIAGFARRLKTMLQQESPAADQETIKKYLDILVDETSRIQEMALSIQWTGKEQVVNLTEVLKKRFEINKEAIKEMLKANVTLREGPYQEPLLVRSFPLHLERILDNLLSNATKAIPLKGGKLSVRTYAEGPWACAEIANSGQISDEDRLKLLEGEGRGRGIYITHRLVRLLKGQIEVKVGKDSTTMIVRFPLNSAQES
ncbi:MAG: GAF domain-containing sensor histidine kinase [Deltaproteobacteria bacterium]|nr:GAF domain-containing sensor histidine kinase [Deltaproteobacteria bacterium]